MAEIHPRLQDPALRFVLLGSSGEALKRPFEARWQETANYPHDDPKISSHLGNIGICGGFGGLHILDCDDTSRWEELAVFPLVPRTFTIESRPGHRQYYIRCPEHFPSGGLYDPEKTTTNEAGKPEYVHIGDLKAGSKDGICGGQAVTPGSRHPSGSTYQVVVDAPIAEVEKEHLQSIINKFRQSKKFDTNCQKAEELVKQARQRRYGDRDPLDSLRVQDIMPPAGAVFQSGDELRGDHPVHGSTNGGNYVVNTAKNVWHCKRCEAGGGPALAIAVKHGLISCSDASPGALRGDLFKQVLKIAREEYGMAGNGNGRGRGAEAEALRGGEPATDGGNAQRLIRLHQNNIKYCHTFKKWMVWDGHRWKIDGDGSAYRFCDDVIKEIYTEAASCIDSKDRQEWAKFAIRSDSGRGYRDMLFLASFNKAIAVTSDQLDVNPHLLNTENVTIDLKTFEAREPRREDLITKSAGARYDPAAECPIWLKFLDKIFKGDKDLISYVQRAAGYTLTGSMVEQVYFFCHGTGANGKSVFLATLRALLGDYAKQASFDTFLIQHTAKVRNDLAALAGARIITASEAEEGSRLSMQVLKSWTGGDPITARFLFGEDFTFRPVGKIWLSANVKPVISERNYAAWRRVHLIPFLVTIPPEEQDRGLENKLLEELPGILIWALEGLKEYHQIGLQPPEAVKAATDAYRRENDSMAAFLSECCEVRKLAICKNSDLFNAYRNFCGMIGFDPLSQTKFSLDLSNKPAIRSTRSMHGMVWHGIDLKPDWKLCRVNEEQNHDLAANSMKAMKGMKANPESFQNSPHEGHFSEMPTYPTCSTLNESRDNDSQKPNPTSNPTCPGEGPVMSKIDRETPGTQPAERDASAKIRAAALMEYGQAGWVDPAKLAIALTLPQDEVEAWLRANYVAYDRPGGGVGYRQRRGRRGAGMTKGKSRTRAAQKSFMRNFEKKRRARSQYDPRQYDKPACEEES